MPLLSAKWINSWWWTDELSETCRVSCQNKFVKLVHLVGFIIKKFVTMHCRSQFVTMHCRSQFVTMHCRSHSSLYLSHRTKSAATDKWFYFCYFQPNHTFELPIYHFSLAEERSWHSPIPVKISPSFTSQSVCNIQHTKYTYRRT
jgi:hypothetical protein